MQLAVTTMGWSVSLGSIGNTCIFELNPFSVYFKADKLSSLNSSLTNIVLPNVYSYGLEKQFNEDLYKDFEQLTLDFYHKGNLYGLEKYW